MVFFLERIPCKVRCSTNLELIRAYSTQPKRGRRLIGLQFEGSGGSSDFLKIRTTEKDFQESGKKKIAYYIMQRLERTGASSRGNFLRSITGVTLISHSLWTSSLEIIEETNFAYFPKMIFCYSYSPQDFCQIFRCLL